MAQAHLTTFDQQMRSTSAAGEKVQKMIKDLAANPDVKAAVKSGVQTDDSAKLDYLSHQMGFFKGTLRAFSLMNTQLSESDFDADEERAARNRALYTEATEMLRTMEVSLNRVANMPDCVFMRVYKSAMQTILEAHPVASFTAFGVGVGGANLFNTWAMANWPLYSHLAASFTGGALSTGGAILVGVVIAVGVLCAIHVIQKLCQDKSKFHEEERAHSKELDRMMKAFNADRLNTEEMARMHETFKSNFLKPVLQPSAADTCLICFHPFASPADAMTAPGCEAGHFVHRHCSADWVRTSGDFRCVYCRRL